MSVEGDLFTVLKGLVGNRAYPDIAPQNPVLPFIVYQQVGGQPINFLSGVPDKRNGRFQINVWAKTRSEAGSIIRQAEDAVRLSPTLLADTLNGALSRYEETTGWYGSQQDFSIWFTT
ncbi:DUF3168 domain-containing protein [Schauerella aestuarii]|uniref:DUF3168 domain-containing protein n=1 Tax=Schauerella aestuarii TaxID=2511204 RepID=UPI001369CB7C|nr:DUF3168 domain-containing protein [Achromobacter aestuarii]MYZ44215.1 DUF3168 domain-containing protein [Achromobacter aestuarii]